MILFNRPIHVSSVLMGLYGLCRQSDMSLLLALLGRSGFIASPNPHKWLKSDFQEDET